MPPALLLVVDGARRAQATGAGAITVSNVAEAKPSTVRYSFQSIISLIVIGVVIARAVNVFH